MIGSFAHMHASSAIHDPHTLNLNQNDMIK